FTGQSLDITGNSGVHLDIAGGPPPPPSGPTSTVVFSRDPIKLGGNAYIDSYDSALGPYGGANIHQQARVTTNAIGAGDVDVDGGSIGGDVEVGPGGNPTSVISNPANVTGEKSAQADPFPLPTITVPTDLGPSIGNVEFADDPFLVTTDLHTDDLRLKNDALVTFSGDIRVLVDGDFTLETRAGFVVAPDSTVEFFIRGRFQVKTGGQSTDPRRVRINLIGDDVTKVETKAQIYGHLVAPDRYVLIKTESQVYGSIQARQLEVITDAAIHQDETNVWDGGEAEGEGGGEGPEVVAGGGKRPYRIRWIENP
ncbi:MAG: hypothetical protein OER86_12045, partial [Phycisphaerae bacterium]|nr:hypothetical protein [Phycisphaerae bacterium]